MICSSACRSRTIDLGPPWGPSVTPVRTRNLDPFRGGEARAADGYRASQDYRGGNEDSLLGNFATRYYLHGRVFRLDTELLDLAQRPFVWSARNVVTPTGEAKWSVQFDRGAQVK